MAIFEDRTRATSFGAAATRYDRRRPAYPGELVEWLTGDAPGDAVDAGCGTGLFGTVLPARGWNVTGIESEERLAAVAERNGLAVDVSTFETWDARTSQFDLVACAQAWHRIDPAVGLSLAASLLRRGGRIAPIRNSYRYDEPVANVIANVIADVVVRHAPHLSDDSVFLDTSRSDHHMADGERLQARAAEFEPPTLERFEHRRHLSVEEWLDELPTYSQFATLPAETRNALTVELARELRRAAADGIRVRHPVHMTTAVRR